jgi:hypothetical protein
MDGGVWKTSRNTAVKVFELQSSYARERDCYCRFMHAQVNQLAGFDVPELVDFQDQLSVLEMTLVAPPCILDFAKAWLDQPADFTAEVLAEAEAEQRELFTDDQWPLVRKVLAALRGHGIYYYDVKPQNVMFPRA